MDGEKKQDMTGRVTAALFDIGIPEHLDGFHYLRYAILLACHDYAKAKYVTKYLYPAVAEEFSVTYSMVESSIRRCIAKAYRRNSEKFFCCFGCTGKITNSRFILTMADRLLREDGVLPKI